MVQYVLLAQNTSRYIIPVTNFEVTNEYICALTVPYKQAVSMCSL